MMKKLFPLLFLSAALLADETDDPLRDSARKGDREAMLKLAHEYFHGLNSRRPDPTVAAYWPGALALVITSRSGPPKL